MAGYELLDGVTVVEMTVHRAGPFCGVLLADLGAEVVKIERPGSGDPARSQGTALDGKSGYFATNNRNKRSVTLDLKSEAGREAAQSLLETADVFVENFGYGVVERLGLGYDELVKDNPELVHASIKGYGETGPQREKRGLDMILQGEAGLMSVTGPEDGEPVKVGQAIGDLTTGAFAALGVLARLYEREQTASEPFHGKFDVGLFDGVATLLNEYLTEYTMTGDVPGTQGRHHQTIVPYGVYETADGAVVTGVPDDDRWPEFVDMLGREELSAYETNAQRRANRERVQSIVAEEFATESTAYWLETLTERGFPNGPINDVGDIAEHEQTAARDLLVDYPEPGWDDCQVPGHPIRYPEYDDESVVRSAAPDLGEDTESVFESLADDQTTLDRWRDGGAFGG